MKKNSDKSHSSIGMFPHRFGRFLPSVTHLASENLILPNFSMLRGVAVGLEPSGGCRDPISWVSFPCMTTEEVPDSWRRSLTTKEDRAVALLMDRECCLKSLASDESSNQSLISSGGGGG